HRARAAWPGGERDLDRAELRERTAARGPPRELDLRARDRDRLPVARDLEGVPVPPPDVLPARIGELQLELVRRRRTGDRELERPALGHGAIEHLPRDDEAAAALEVELQGERCGTRGARRRLESELGEAGRDRHPARRVTEVVQDRDAAHARARGCRPPSCMTTGTRRSAMEATDGEFISLGRQTAVRLWGVIRNFAGSEVGNRAIGMGVGLLVFLLAINGLNVVNSYVG